MADHGRPHDVTGLTASELDRARHDLTVSLALIRPGSPACVPIVAEMNAIDTELAQRQRAGQASSPRQAMGYLPPAAGGRSQT